MKPVDSRAEDANNVNLIRAVCLKLCVCVSSLWAEAGCLLRATPGELGRRSEGDAVKGSLVKAASSLQRWLGQSQASTLTGPAGGVPEAREAANRSRRSFFHLTDFLPFSSKREVGVLRLGGVKGSHHFSLSLSPLPSALAK